jgi:hypothetical protein
VHVLKKAPEEPFSPALKYGSLVHATLKGVFDPSINAPPWERDVETVARRVIHRIGYPAGEAELRDADLARCITTVQAYVEQEGRLGTTIAVEAFDKVKITSGTARPLVLGAKFDRLLTPLDDAGHLVIQDFKTGTPGCTDMDGACIMLAVACARSGKEYRAFTVRYDYLNGRGLAERREVTAAEAKAVWPDLKERALRVYNATSFPAEPGEHCCFCPLREECRPSLSTDLDTLDGFFS